MDLGARLANAAVSCAAYLVATCGPVGWRSATPLRCQTLAGSRSLGALLLLLSDAVLRRAAVQPFLAIGWSWFIGMLVPVSGLVTFGYQARADRFTYLPSSASSLA